MRVAIYQPQYFPRLHYVNRGLAANVFVQLASAQYTKSLVHNEPDGTRVRHKSFQNHAVIRTDKGDTTLTVPLQKLNFAPIDGMLTVDDPKWARQHLGIIRSAYGKAARFGELFHEVETILMDAPGRPLGDLNVRSLLWGLSRCLGVSIPLDELSVKSMNEAIEGLDVPLDQIVVDRDLACERPDGRSMGTEWTIAISKEVGATEYVYGGTASSSYMDGDAYAEAGLALVQQDWTCPRYPQMFEDRHEFRANLSILDLAFNASPDIAISVLLGTE